MVDRLGLGPEERELKLGASFTNPKENAFHTVRYDFKPASVDTNKMATIDVGTNSQVTVTFPPNLVFNGSSKAYNKKGIVIINPKTGEVTLEKLSCNISVKKVRSENQRMSAQKRSMLDQLISGQAKPKKVLSTKGSKRPVSSVNNSTLINSSSKSSSLKQGSKSKLDSQHNTTSLLPIHTNSSRNSPNSQVRFPSGLSPSNASQAKVAIDDHSALDDWFNSVDSSRSHSVKQDIKKTTPKEEDKLKLNLNDEGAELSDSSSSSGSSSSGDSSYSSSDSESQPKKKVCENGRLNNGSPHPEDLLKEDLQLSESGSDSD